jgi:hypothetical protein
MLDGSEQIAHRSPYPLGGRVRCDQERVLFFEPDQLAEQHVVLGVGNLGFVKDVIPITVIPKLLTQLFDPLLRAQRIVR